MPSTSRRDDSPFILKLNDKSKKIFTFLESSSPLHFVDGGTKTRKLLEIALRFTANQQSHQSHVAFATHKLRHLAMTMETTVMNRRKAMLVGSTAILGISGGIALAQTYPSKPITLIVPFAPGGSTDHAARLLAIPLSKILGQPVIVHNRSGAGGAVGAPVAARATPDGYTLFFSPASVVASLPQMIKTTYKRQDLIPVSLAAKISVILVTKAEDSRFKTIEDLAALARSQNGAVSAGQPAPGSPNHLALLQLETAFKCKFNAIPYKGSGPALTDLLGGTLDIYFDQVSSSMQYLKAGSLRSLVIFSPTPDPALPDVKTTTQLGLGEIDATTYTGVFAPAGTQSEIISRLNTAIKLATQDSSMSTILNEAGGTAIASTPGEFERIIVNEESLVKAFIKEGRLKSAHQEIQG